VEPEEGLQGNLRFPAAEPEEGKSVLENEIKSSPHTKQGTASKTLKKMSSKTVAKTHLKTFKKDGIKVLDTLSEKDVETMIIVANDAYYNSKNPLLTDNEYDIVREYAETKYPDNQTIKQVGAPITKNKVTLPYNMPSMDKIKPDTNALTTWTQKYSGPYVLSCKLDGVSGMYTTEGPEPKLYTRGDGKVGQDVSHLLRALNLPPKKEGNAGHVVRGEFILPKHVFDEKYKAQFANPRNLVSGIVNSKTLDDKTRDLHFVAYEVINPPLKISEQMALLAELGHEVVKHQMVDSLTNDLLSETLLDWRANYEYEVDGVIVADNNLHPRKDGNPEHAFAFKMVISDQMAEAKVVDVLWTPSKSGYLKPRVQIEPIKLGGVTIQYATGFNGDFIEKNKIGVGAVIQLVRSGDVIPHIKSVTTPAEITKMPDQPYTWTKNHVDIVLENVEEDVTVRRKNITEFFTKLEVDGLSGKTVEKIMDAGFDTIPKILKMTKADFAKVKGFQETMVNKIHDGIRAQVGKATLLDIMAASNLFGRGIGERKIRPILEAEPTILTDPGTAEEKYQRLIRIKGIGQENAQSFTQNIDRFLAFLEACGLADKLTQAPAPAPKENVLVRNDHPLSGKHVVMSGVRDAAVKARVESLGGVVDDTIGSKTFILVVKSKGEKETSKMKYAREHNIEIMEPAEFLEKYN
jgi:NAD-dependent DNA ligase